MTSANSVAQESFDELSQAILMFPPMRSAHEGYAIILEELDELWEEIRNNKADGSNERQRKEAIQVAAMAMRFVLDISDKGKHRNEIAKDLCSRCSHPDEQHNSGGCMMCGCSLPKRIF